MGDRGSTSNTGAGNSGAFLSGFAGALIGAAGLAWWLLSEAENRRDGVRTRRQLRLSRLGEVEAVGQGSEPSQGQIKPSTDLHHRVHELNQAIDEVRQQLEEMATTGR
ncbi:hypothetical protein [Cyanobium sp. WAJ14-Wanaka]|uniref:hypothetical protein n=1 Tax=Cyanobium sp. WAJ14-Wanaka TaxID=2823725 RepID=UPI0020CECE91|nr:hypothetical protein [Cyanobium sp. WAJ14-Wanaka]MCP9774571.1 hypothetical protein [Cyanobium sp. WAJ14-Wanaka]